jgi:hypothetical protein
MRGNGWMWMAMVAVLGAAPVMAQDQAQPQAPTAPVSDDTYPSADEIAEAQKAAKGTQSVQGYLVVPPAKQTLVREKEQEFTVLMDCREMKFKFKKDEEKLSESFKSLKSGDSVTVDYKVDAKGNRNIESLKK